MATGKASEHIDLESDFYLGPVLVRPLASTLEVEDESRRVDYKAMRVLLCLAKGDGREVAKSTLFDEVWQGSSVTDDVLTGAVSTLRKALADDPRAPRFIQTIPRIGYRLIAPVAPVKGTRPGRSVADDRAARRWLVPVLALVAVVLIAALVGRWAALVELARPRADAAGLRPPAPTVDPAAQEAYLRGRYLAQVDGGTENLTRALEELDRAVAWAPGHAAAHLAAARAWLQAVERGLVQPLIGLERLRLASQRVLELDPESAPAHVLLGVATYLAAWRFDAAETLIRQGLELGPDDAFAHVWLARLLTTRGRFDEALATLRRVRELDPEAYARPRVAKVLLLMGQAELALEEVERQIEVEPAAADLRLQRGFVLLELDRTDEAVRTILDAMVLAGSLEAGTRVELAARYEDEGIEGLYRFFLAATPPQHLDLVAASEAMRGRTAAQAWSEPGPTAMANAELLIGAGEVERGLDWLELAVEKHEPDVVTLGSYSFFDGLREHPRFRALITKMGL